MSTFDRRRRWILDAALGCALVLPSCKTEKEPVTTPPVTGGDPVDGAAVELAPIDEAAQMLPRDTSVFVSATSIARVAEVFERERLLEQFRPQYEGLRGLMVGGLGHDLLDPGAWADVGLDAQGPVGIALADVINGQLVLLATISDRAKLAAWVRDTAGKGGVEIVEDAYGPASVLRSKDGIGPSVVMRDDVVALVLEGREPSRELAASMATMEPNLSLAGQVGYRKAAGGLRPADATVFFDIERIVEQTNADAESRTNGPGRNWAQEELERAQKEGAPAERLADLERQVKEEEERQARWRAVEDAERALGELLVSGVDGVALTFTAKRGGPILDGRVAAGEEAFVRRLFDNRQGAPVLPVAMNGAPVWCASGKVGTDAFFELLEATAATDAKDWPAFLTATKAEIGLDLDADLRPALGGEAGWCLTVEGKLDPAAERPSDALGLGAFVQVTDEAKAKYLLAKIATSRSTLAGRMKKRGGGYQLSMPDFRPLYLDPVGDRIVISSDPDLATRIAKGDPGSMPSKIVPVAARGAMKLEGTAGAQALDLSLMTMFFAVGRMSMGEMEFSAPGLSAEEMKKVPLSKRSKKARKALDKAKAQVQKVEDQRTAAEMDMILAITDPMGIGVVAATEDDRGFTLTGGQFIRAKTVGAVLEAVLRGVTTNEPRMTQEQREAMEKAWEAQSKAEQEWMDARMEDAERFLAKKKKR